ncbi:unnamed protein product [Cuscuta campestris]|uniref:Reverse transcriptase domain-containing protein n=1 Tax=Cuscuta campestris TaxID=132261 RepID=A0A484NMU4_9ASTE|nr:unnamed protein product [Cuscuta campestris]
MHRGHRKPMRLLRRTLHSEAQQMRRRRTNLKIRAIRDIDDKLIETEDGIKRATEKHFEETCSNTKLVEAGQILNHIPSLITNDDNNMMSAIPDEMEIRKAVWDLNPNSAAGPGAFNGCFFRNCWDIVKHDVIKASQEFFMGLPVPQAYGSTLITLIPKKENYTTFSDFRPISLSTFMSKHSSPSTIARMAKALNMKHEKLPISYLGVTIRKGFVHFRKFKKPMFLLFEALNNLMQLRVALRN